MKAKILTLTAVNAAILALATSGYAQTTAYDADVTPAGPLTFGTGNLNGGFKVVTDNGGSLELGLRGKLDHQNVFPDAGNGVYVVPTGAGNSGAGPGTDATRASWNYEFAINVNANGNSQATLGSYTFQLLVDADPGTSDNFHSFNPLILDNSPLGSATVAQNSENAIFPFVGPDGYNPNVPGIYDIELIATDALGHSTTDEITIEVGDVSHVPDASSTMPLLGAALAGMALLRRKFKA